MGIFKNKFVKLSCYLGFFLCCTVVFVYLTFPYAVLKESLTSMIRKESGFLVSMEELRPSLPLGIKAKNISISKRGNSNELEFRRIKLNISVFKLLVARLGIHLSLEESSKGSLELDNSIKILPMISSNKLEIVKIRSKLKNFEVNKLIAFGLGEAARTAINPLVKSSIGILNVEGKLNGHFDLSFPNSEYSNAEGDIDIKIKSGGIEIGEAESQSFEKARFKALVKKGRLSWAQDSGIASEDLDLKINGSLKFAKDINQSTLAMNMPIMIEGPLRESYGFVLPDSSSGKYLFNLTGSVTRPQQDFKAVE